MNLFKKVICKASLASAIALLSLASACSKPAEPPKTSADSSTATSQHAATKLGDLSEFRGIASDVAGLVDKNDLEGAKKRIKDLESSWDDAEAGIKPRAASDWHVLDKAIDRALDALRDSSPQQGTCKAAMTDLLKAFDDLQGKA